MIFETILKGLLIGLSISVPLGPIGMLCVQRTLNHGRKHGIVTGLGATTSDLIYILISIFFLSVVVDVVEENRQILQLVGSILVVGFGIWIMRSNPVKHPTIKESSQSNLVGDYLSSFMLTLSNPLIIFVLIALFTRFEFVSRESSITLTIVGILFVLIGATSWWLIITYFVSHFRKNINIRGLKLINLFIGGVIILIGIVGIIFSLTTS